MKRGAQERAPNGGTPLFLNEPDSSKCHVSCKSLSNNDNTEQLDHTQNECLSCFSHYPRCRSQRFLVKPVVRRVQE